jgi:quercetin dioxygenase-like cupin family protein
VRLELGEIESLPRQERVPIWLSRWMFESSLMKREERAMLDVILKRFEEPDEVRTFEKGRFEVVRVGGMTIGRATYEPGWKWSEHVGKAAGAKSCAVEHVGMVISGRATAAMNDGRVIEMKAGDVFYIAPGHDSWVVGEDPYVSLHFLGADAYAKAKKG